MCGKLQLHPRPLPSPQTSGTRRARQRVHEGARRDDPARAGGCGANVDWGRRIIVHNPFRRGWSIRLGRLWLRRVPWYWDVLWERLAESSAKPKPGAPPPARHDHYCEECDRRWVHEGQTCATSWAAPCAGERHHRAGTVRQRLGQWFIVVRRDRAELCRQLGKSFGADPRVTVVLDRRQSERCVPRGHKASVAAERWRDRRAPQTDEDRSLWANLGFRAHQDRAPEPR